MKSRPMPPHPDKASHRCLIQTEKLREQLYFKPNIVYKPTKMGEMKRMALSRLVYHCSSEGNCSRLEIQ